MANKKISELDSRASLSLSDLLAVGDPTTGYLYKITITDLKSLTGAGVISFNGRVGAVSPAEGDYTLNQLGDVIITSASNGQVLQYNGSNWVNASLTAQTLDTVTTNGNTTANSITVGSVSAAGLSNLLGQIKTFTSTGNVYIGANPGTAIDAGYKLDVNGTLRSQGIFYGVQMFTGAHSFRDQMYITATTDGWTKQSAYNAASAYTMGFVGDLRFAFSTAVKAVFSFNGSYSNNGTIYSGDSSLMKIFTGDAFGNTVGATTYNGYGINLMPTLNYTTGTSNFTGIYYNPTLTATTGLTHYAMNLVAGLVKMGTLAGTGTRIVTADANGNLTANALLSNYVTLNDTQNIIGQKTFTTTTYFTASPVIDQGTSSIGMRFKQYDNSSYNLAGYTDIVPWSNDRILFAYNQGGTDFKSFTFRVNNLSLNTNRDYQMPNASGTLALTSDIPSLSGYVPYTGATADLNMGTRFINAQSFISGAGIFLSTAGQSVPGSGSPYTTINAQSDGIDIRPSNNLGIFRFIFPGTSRNYTFPDAAGTVALTSDLSAYASLNGNQTISGTKVFTADTTFSGVTFGTSAYLSGFVQPTNGIVLPHGGSRVTGSGQTSISVSGTNGIMVGFPSGQFSALAFPTASTNTYTFPDASGTVALTSQTGTIQTGGYYLTGMTAGSGALYYNSGANRVTLANYNSGGSLKFEVNGGNEAMNITSAGNVLIGTTTEWSYSGLIGLGVSTIGMYGYTGYAGIGFNIRFYSNSWKYVSNGGGAYLELDPNSNLVYYTAPSSGTAGASATTTERMRISSAGNVMIGVNDNAARLVVRGSSTSGSDFALWVTNSIGQLGFSVRNDLLICSPGTYSYSYASTANVFVQSDGYLGRNTSSLKYKKNVEDYSRGLDDVLKLRPVLYESKNPSEADRKFTGFIAEEIDALGLTEFVQYANDGTPDALQYPHFVALLAKAIQEQQVIINDLKAKIN